MRLTTCVWAGVAMLAMAQAAQAAPPKVAGKYAVMIFEQCTSSFNYANDSFQRSAGGSGPGVKSISPTQNGEFGIEVGTFFFPGTASGAGDAHVELTNVHGDALRIKGGGSPVTSQPESLAGTFSLNATTFTFKPTGEPEIVWTASYGNINTANGLVRTVYLVRKGSDTCVQGLSLTKQ